MAGFSGGSIPSLGLEQIYDRDNHLNGAGNDGYGKCRVTSLSVPGNPSSWADNITALTIITVIKVNGTDTGYAYHPINKWNSSHANNASFILYHFQNYQGTNPNSANRMTWYGNNTANDGTGWGGLCGSGNYHATQGKTHMIVAQFNSTDGGQMWTGTDGSISKHGGRGSSGARGQTTSNSTSSALNVYGPTTINSIQEQLFTAFWSRELTDTEIEQVFFDSKRRFNME